MALRSIRSTVTFPRPFTLSGYSDELPAGEYEVLVEEELIETLSFPAYRRTAIFLTINGKGRSLGRTEMRPITWTDLETALGRGIQYDT
ncbi:MULTISPECIES: hypothetical protein [Ruegeria]|uniref:Uncharacterized protein n=1 Tax=Ruegeria conchae TaxID=981384 RepID=A0A497ZFE6_9RHOB|nr:hypothetical protein [Ruegeria conchae]RLK07281.1 hypothetical protein CLV75_2397 [Ruegeria conchae]UWR05704.1 hypothetical protein K3740_20855 [Ruegeria conchae]